MSHYKSYSVYRDSGIEWLGNVPSHWVVCAMKRLATICNGRDHKPVENPDGEYPVFGSGGEFARADSYLYDGESVLLGRKGTIDRPMYVNGRFWTVDTMFYTQIHSHADGRFLFYAASAIPFDLYSTNTALPSMTQEALASNPIAVPSGREQHEIARALDRETASIDALIAKKTRFIELLKEKRQALITHAVTKGLDPTAPVKHSGVDWIGSVPAHWAVRPLRYVATVQTGVAKGKDMAGKLTTHVPYLRVANVQDGFLDLSDVAEIELPVEELPRYTLKRGDVLMNEGGDYDKLGRGHIWSGEIDPCIHQNHVFAVRPTRVSSEWLNTFTGSRPAQFYFASRSKQSTNLASISSSNLMDLPVTHPPADEQMRILRELSTSLSRIDVIASKTQQSIELLRERRSALITAAVTGQIDLRADP